MFLLHLRNEFLCSCYLSLSSCAHHPFNQRSPPPYPPTLYSTTSHAIFLKHFALPPFLACQIHNYDLKLIRANFITSYFLILFLLFCYFHFSVFHSASFFHTFDFHLTTTHNVVPSDYHFHSGRKCQRSVPICC